MMMCLKGAELHSFVHHRPPPFTRSFRRYLSQAPPAASALCKRAAGCAFLAAAGLATGASPSGRLLPSTLAAHHPSKASAAAVSSALSCACIPVRRRAWLAARRTNCARLACIPGTVRALPDLEPWRDACQSVLQSRQLLLGIVTATGAPAPSSGVDSDLGRLISFYAPPPPPQHPPALEVVPPPLPMPPLLSGPVLPLRADAPRPGVVGRPLPAPLAGPPVSALLTLKPAPPPSRGAQQQARPSLPQTATGGTVARGSQAKPATAAPSLDGVRFVALPPPPAALRLAAPTSPSAALPAVLPLASSPPDAPSPAPSSLSPGGLRSNSGPSARASVSLAVAIQASLAHEGAALAEAFDAALRRGAAPAVRRTQPLAGLTARVVLPPAGRFIHSATGVPVTQAEDPVDSEDELGHPWLADESAARLRALDDVSPEDKAVMLLWNGFAAEGRAVYSATALPQACVLFARSRRATLRRLGLRAALLRLLMHLWDGAALDAESVAACLAALDEEGGGGPGEG